MRALRAIVPALLLAACTGGLEVPQPRLSGVDPSHGDDDKETPVIIQGDHFVPRVKTDFSKPAASQLDDSFRVSLIRSDAEAPEVDLGAAKVIDSKRLVVTVPVGVPRGFYSVKVVDPRGRATTLTEVYRVVRASRNVAAFRVESVGQQRVGVPFLLQVAAVDGDGETVDGFSGDDARATLSDSTQSIAPAQIGPFALGRARATVTVVKAMAGDVIKVEDAAGHSGQSSAFDVLTGLPAQIAFASAGPSVAAGACSDRVDLLLQDRQGIAAPTASALRVRLAAAPPERFAFFSDPGCTAPVDAVTFAAGESRTSLWVRGERAGGVLLRAQPERLPSASMPVTVNAGAADRLEFVSASPVVATGACAPAVALQLGDAFGNARALGDGESLIVDLQSLPAGALTFFSDETCTTARATLNLGPGDGGAKVYARGTHAGTSTLRASPRTPALLAGDLVFTVTP